jgi:hypothetical protein
VNSHYPVEIYSGFVMGVVVMTIIWLKPTMCLQLSKPLAKASGNLCGNQLHPVELPPVEADPVTM